MHCHHQAHSAAQPTKAQQQVEQQQGLPGKEWAKREPATSCLHAGLSPGGTPWWGNNALPVPVWPQQVLGTHTPRQFDVAMSSTRHSISKTRKYTD